MHSGYQVAGYRLYGLDGVNKVASGEVVEAEDDQTAIQVAKTLMDGHDCELWQGRRLRRANCAYTPHLTCGLQLPLVPAVALDVVLRILARIDHRP